MGRNPEGLGNFFGYNHLLNAGVAALLAGSMAMGSEPPAQARQISPDTNPRPSSPPITEPDPGFQAQVDLTPPLFIPPYKPLETSKHGRVVAVNSSPTQGTMFNGESDFEPSFLEKYGIPKLIVIHDNTRPYPNKPSDNQQASLNTEYYIGPTGEITLYYGRPPKTNRPVDREEETGILYTALADAILERTEGKEAIDKSKQRDEEGTKMKEMLDSKRLLILSELLWRNPIRLVRLR